MPKKISQGWETLEQELYEAGVDPAEVAAGARRLLAERSRHERQAALDEMVRICGEADLCAGTDGSPHATRQIRLAICEPARTS